MPDLLAERKGGAVLVTLNRPDSLNALNLLMVLEMSRVVDKAAADDRVFGLVLRGAGDRAFCAGGDIKAAREGGLAWKAGSAALDETVTFFAAEYALNRSLFHFPKPVVAVMDGITMGGGVGISAPCRFRIATTRTRWAMPETGIGFFSDVGTGYHLTRLPGRLGYYLGLTGLTLSSARDLTTARLATHFMPSETVPEMIAALIDAPTPERFLRTIKSVNIMKDQPRLLDLQRIDQHFAHPTIEDILYSLDWAEDEWASRTAAVLRTKSPTSLKLTLAHLQKAAGEEFDQVSMRDLDLAKFCLHGHDFYEGIRAALVDKDKAPRWSPSRLEDVILPDLS